MKNKLIERIKNGNLTIVKTLLANGANINYQDEDGNTPLMWAAGVIWELCRLYWQKIKLILIRVIRKVILLWCLLLKIIV